MGGGEVAGIQNMTHYLYKRNWTLIFPFVYLLNLFLNILQIKFWDFPHFEILIPKQHRDPS